MYVGQTYLPYFSKLEMFTWVRHNNYAEVVTAGCGKTVKFFPPFSLILSLFSSLKKSLICQMVMYTFFLKRWNKYFAQILYERVNISMHRPETERVYIDA